MNKRLKIVFVILFSLLLAIPLIKFVTEYAIVKFLENWRTPQLEAPLIYLDETISFDGIP